MSTIYWLTIVVGALVTGLGVGGYTGFHVIRREIGSRVSRPTRCDQSCWYSCPPRCACQSCHEITPPRESER